MHDIYLNQLSETLEGFYDKIYTKVNFKNPDGEIDILGIKNGYMDAYEVKVRNRRTKATRQLKKIKKRIGSRAGYFFYYEGCTNNLEKLYI